MSNEKYFQLAVSWGKQYLEDNVEPKQLTIAKHKIVTNDLKFVETQITRIEQGKGAARLSSYCLLKEFKDFIEKIKQNSLLNKLID